MGHLDNGVWRQENRWSDDAGAFRRKVSSFRSWVTADGSPGPSGESGFAAEPGRYHLYVSLACPWAHRTLIVRALKGLDDMIGLTIVHWHMGENGWELRDGPGTLPDTIHGAHYLHEIYVKADPAYTGRVTVPILWDKARHTIVSNESAEIIRMLNSAFDAVGAKPVDFSPAALCGEIETVNARVYDTLNNGVYKAGFATTQEAYEAAVHPLFDTLDWLEARLSDRRYLLGKALTEADIRLFTTLVRFDPVYHGHFKCNLRRLTDYPNLWAYTRDLYQRPAFRDTTDFHHIKHHYYASHRSVNPTGIVPSGPILDFEAPHGRDRIAEAA